MRVLKSDCTGVTRIDGEANDCTVRALANGLGAPYKIAHRIMADAGRKRGCGVLFDAWHSVYTRLGFRLISVHGTTRGARYVSFRTGIAPQPGSTLENIMHRLQNGRYIVKIRGHVLAVVDGKIMDIGWNLAGSKVQAIYKLDQQAVIFDK
jgi:hypothetical protein